MIQLGILTTLETKTWSNDPFVRLDSIALEGDKAILSLSILDYDESTTWQRWAIKTGRLIDYEVRSPWGDLEMHGPDHVLARQHIEPVRYLTFHGSPHSAAEVVGLLLTAHREIVADCIPFSRYLNTSNQLESLLDAGFGKLADGPAFLMEAYARVLQDHGMRVRLSSARPNKSYTDGQWVANPSGLSVLRLGDSFFVSEMFDDERLSDG